jgi:FtsH-binding integral membrane protein
MIFEIATDLYSSGAAAESVLRQIILALGGVSAGLAMVYGVWYVRNSRSGRWVLLAWLTSYVGLTLLTTQHVYAHLQTDSAPAWQLVSAIIVFSFGIFGLVNLMRHRAEIVPTENPPLR